jgi:hypothetical protein
MRLVKILIRKRKEVDLVELTQVDPTFVGLGVRYGLIGRYSRRCFLRRKVIKDEMQMQHNAKVENNVE